MCSLLGSTPLRHHDLRAQRFLFFSKKKEAFSLPAHPGAQLRGLPSIPRLRKKAQPVNTELAITGSPSKVTHLPDREGELVLAHIAVDVLRNKREATKLFV